MTGAILCGGQSLRMGSDKGLLMGTRKKVWAEIVKEKLSQIHIPSVLSINPSQKANYLPYFKGKDLVVDNSIIAIQGPLLGVLSAHLACPDQDLLVVACDMINLDNAVLLKLLSEYSSSKAEAIAFKSDRIEPLCAIYSSQGLTKILAACQSKKLAKNSMTHVLERLNTEYISIPEEWTSSFKNFNSVEDLNE